MLDKINSPQDLKTLSVEELKAYSSELRQYLLEVMSQVGGHVAANLGVVELTAALHYVFDTPNDQIVWDVGHQCYAHKIITGRREKFPTIRQAGGLSGFTKISESPHDAFGAGHSSTSISAGLGLAEAHYVQNKDRLVLSVVGDGALTAGLAYEGLNHAGHLKRPNHIVIFNDNEMSISENVGALARFFSRRITSKLYNRAREEIRTKLKALSNNELDLYEKVRALGHAVKDLFSASSFFEALGFRYIGPIDGHNLDELIETFRGVREVSLQTLKSARSQPKLFEAEPTAPILVHVKTKKGLGLMTAEKSPGDFHGVSGFCKVTGTPVQKKNPLPTYTQVFSQTLCQLAESDPLIVAVTAAMPDGTGLSKFQKLFPHRFYDVGIAEQHAVTFSGAMRLAGLKPAVAIYSTFLQRAYDQVIHDVAIQKIPLTLFLDRAGLVGADGPTHHGAFDLSYLRCIPGFYIMTPKDENELQHMVYTAMNCGKLVAVRFPRGEGIGVPLESPYKMLPLGKAERLVHHIQPEVSFWAAGTGVQTSLAAARRLRDEGIACEVVNTRFIKPLDTEALKQDAQKVKLIVTVEENSIIGGLGSAVLESLSQMALSVPVINVGIPDEFIEHGSQDKLKAYAGLDESSLVAKVKSRLALDGQKLLTRKVVPVGSIPDTSFPKETPTTRH